MSKISNKDLLDNLINPLCSVFVIIFINIPQLKYAI